MNEQTVTKRANVFSYIFLLFSLFVAYLFYQEKVLLKSDNGKGNSANYTYANGLLFPYFFTQFFAYGFQ